jgi:hypothetical protein
MKKILTLLFVLVAFACKDQLDVKNPNEPSLDALNSETGIINFSTGIYNYLNFPNNFDFFWVTNAAHEIMGDALFIPFGNFGWRWANQPSSITLDNGTVVRPPQEGDQAISLKNRNSREQGSDNLFAHEWVTMYFVNNAANVLLETVESGNVQFSDNAETKRKVITAWAHWWKGFAYSRIGSMYVSGLILDESGKTNGNFVDNEQILAEAEEHFNLAITILNSVSEIEEETFISFLSRIVPSHLYDGNNDVPAPDEWVRNINTMRARNLMVNKKVSQMTTAEWTAILQLANNGLQDGDFEFVIRQDGNNFVTTTLLQYRVAPTVGWHFASERLIQDFKPGDNRFTRNFALRGTWIVNNRQRGIQYGTRYNFVAGGDYCSIDNLALDQTFAGTYTENELIKAEATLRSGGNIDQALALIDGVRDDQNAQLAAVANTGLTLLQALEELRRERRIGLLLKGLSFYDARRWGVIDPVASGGGRTGSVVISATGVLNTNATFDYKYMDYFDVPLNELDFNSPTSSTPIIENPK